MSATTCPHPHSNTLHTLRLTQALLDDFGRAFLEQVTNPVPAFVLVCMGFFDIVEDMIGNHGWHFEQVFSSKSMKLFIYLSTIKCSIQIQHYQLTTKEYTYVYDRWPCSDCFAPCFQPNYPAMELAMDSALEIAEDPATTWRSVRFLIGLNGFYSKKSTFLLASELGSFVNFPLETKYQTTKKMYGILQKHLNPRTREDWLDLCRSCI